MVHRYKCTIHLVAKFTIIYIFPFMVIVNFASIRHLFISAMLILETCSFPVTSIL